MPARHAMPVQKLEKACTVTQAALAPLCSGFVVLRFASSANTPVGKNRKPSQIGGHFPFEHVQPVLQSPCASLVSCLFRTHFPVPPARQIFSVGDGIATLELTGDGTLASRDSNDTLRLPGWPSR